MEPIFQSQTTSIASYTALYTSLDNEYQRAYLGQGPTTVKTAQGEAVYSATLPRARPSVAVGSASFMAEMPLPEGPFLDFMPRNVVSPMTHRLMRKGWITQTVLTYFAHCIPDGLDKSMIRRSARNLINRGLPNTRITEKVRNLQALHKEVHGETRSAETWRIQQEMINQGKAFVVEMDGAAGLFYHNNDLAYYACAASRYNVRTHPMIARAMIHAGEIGCQWLELGNACWSHNNKMRNISFFKEAFSSITKARILVYHEKDIDFDCVTDARQIHRSQAESRT